MQTQAKQCVLQIDKINCASCVEKIETQLGKLDGVISSSVNFASGKAIVEFFPEKISEEKIMLALKQIGYPARKYDQPHAHHEDSFRFLAIQTSLAFLLSLPLGLTMLGLSIPLWWQLLLATIVQFGGGYRFYISTWQGLKHLSTNMDTLVALGTSAAYGYSLYAAFAPGTHHMYFESSAFLISFILLGKLLELKTKREAGMGMQALMQLQPKMAHVWVEGEIKEMAIEEVSKGALFIVRPGEKVPFDGVIVEGQTHLNETMLTGESLPLEKKEGGRVFAGTLNQEGLLKVQVTEVGAETTLGHILKLVEQAQLSKAPIQRLADRITAFFVPIILVIALMTFIAWWAIGFDPAEGLIDAIAVLVVACPCALGLATPTAVMVACSKAAREGILIKNAEVLELAKNIHTLFLDKTGTATAGEPSVIQFVKSESYPEDVLSLVLGLANFSDHPSSKAISQYLNHLNLSSLQMSNFTSFPGKGLSGMHNGKTYYLGSIPFLASMKIDTSEFDQSWKQEIDMIVAFADEKRALGYFLLADQIREETKQAVQDFHQLGMKVFLLTGDRTAIAARVAKEIGADVFKAEILPERKANYIESLKHEGEVTAMVGDGINDAPALAKADVGIAIGAGSDVALESASIILVRPELTGVVRMVVLAHKAFRTIRQNLYFAFGYNCLCIPIAAFGLLNPVIAGILMAASSVSVVSNSLLLNRQSLSLK